LTRKSQPKSEHFPVAGRHFLLGLVIGLTGCSTFSPFGRSDKDYEKTKRTINGRYGDGVFRPEGAAAESEESNIFLDTLGFSRSRRKDIDAARESYAMAEEAFNQAKQLEGQERREAFRAAATAYQKAADNWRSSQLEQDALLMKAESLFFAEDYYKAEQTYANLVKEYPRNPYLDQIDSRRFEIADFWLKTHSAAPRSFAQVNFTDNTLPWNDTAGHGKRVLENLRMDNPLGKLSDDATMRLAVSHFEKGDYESAAATFGELRMTYPDSEHQFDAQFFELQSLLLSYLGPEYSDVPLIEAEKRIKTIVRLFPKESAAKQLELREAAAKTKYLMAEREWESAQYRYRQGENLAARMYLQQLIEKYPDTPYAESSRELLAQIGDKPDRPAQRFAPLVRLMRADSDKRPWTRPNSDPPQ
jgi:outer membrane protein assembly factor BamD (BamD/ComL family)